MSSSLIGSDSLDWSFEAKFCKLEKDYQVKTNANLNKTSKKQMPISRGDDFKFCITWKL